MFQCAETRLNVQFSFRGDAKTAEFEVSCLHMDAQKKHVASNMEPDLHSTPRKFGPKSSYL
ncbi:hypothetical protein SAMN05428948_0831 [Massilia sp. CF038]|nr:hypothetical protein SAMN05428948_0831 [Massilia sp. CF038]